MNGALLDQGWAALAEDRCDDAAAAFLAALETAPQEPLFALAGLAAAASLSDPGLAAEATAAAWVAAPPPRAAAALIDAFSIRVPETAVIAPWAAILDAHPPRPDEDLFPRLIARALALWERQDWAAAAPVIDDALALRPDHRGARWLAYLINAAALRYDAACAQVAAGDLTRWMDVPSLRDYAALLVRASQEDETELRRVLTLMAARRPPVAALRPAPTDPTGRPLRVGLCQGAFHNRPYYAGLIPLLDGLSRAGAALFAYHVGPALGAAPPALAPYLNCWRDLDGLDPDAAARCVAADHLDVLLDLEGLSSNAPTELYARRPAPVLASGYNTLCTLGPGLFDWVIGDVESLPPEADAQYDEALARLPAGFSFTPNRFYGDVDPPLRGADGPLTLGGFCQEWKISPQCAAAWAEILRARPEARLILRTPGYRHATVVADTQSRLAAAGAPLDQIVFDGEILPYDAFLQRYDQLDVMLDPFPFQGPTTIFDALWRGVPVVARQGSRWTARMGGAVITAAGFPQWVTKDADAYVRVALALLDSAPHRRRTTARQAQRDAVAASGLCDFIGYGRALEGLLRRMTEDAWRRSR